MKLYRVLTAVLLVAILLTACSPAALATQVAPAAPTAETGDILIGNFQDLSGLTAAWGEGQTNGTKMAIDEINAKGGLLGGRKLKLITYDFKGQVPESINAYTRLATQDKVTVVLGPSNSAVHIALGPVTADLKVPIVSDPIDERATTPKEGSLNKYIFLLTSPSSGQQARILASYAINTLKYTKVAVLYDQGSAFAISLAAPFADYYTRHKGTVASYEPYETGAKDFKAQLLKIKSTEPQAIMIPVYLQDVIVITKQMKDVGLNIPIIGLNTLGAPYAEQVCPDGNGTIFLNNADLGDPKLAPLMTKYKDTFKKDPVINVLFGYDNVMVVAKAIENAGSTKSEDIVNALENIKDFPGYLGTVTTNPATHRSLNFPMVVQKIENCKYTNIATGVLPQD
jgi:branched-chain amino acid transport system substrate-binding protein